MTVRLAKFILFAMIAVFPYASKAQWDIPHSMEAGQNALDFHDYKTAIAIFNRIVASRPNSHKAYYFRSIAKQNLGDYTGSENDLTQTLSLNPFYYEAYEQRGAVRFIQGKYAPAAKDYEQATLFNNGRMDIWSNLILSELKTEDFSAADSLSELMIRKWPKKADGYLLKSRARYGMGMKAEAEALTDSALNQDPFHLPSLTVKANFLMADRKWEEATSMYSRALHIHPKNSKLLICRGLCKMMWTTEQEARADFSIARDIAPDDALTKRCAASTSKEEMKEIEQEVVAGNDFLYPDDIFYITRNTDAAYIINKYDMLPPQYLSDYQKEAYNPPTSFTSGYGQLYQHDFLAAVSLLSESISLNPNIPEAYYNRAFAYAKSNSIDKAIKDLGTAIDKRPAYAEAYYNRAILKLWLNDIDGARSDLSKAGELGIEMAYKIIQEMN